MRLRSSLGAVFAFVLIVVAAPEANGGGGTPITNCGQTVTTSAVLTQDLVCTGSGVIVGASGITIDLKGSTLRGDRDLTDYGIDDSGGFDHVTVKNGVLRNFGEGVWVVSASPADKIAVSNVVAAGNLDAGIAVSGDSASIKSSSASGNANSIGIEVFGDSAKIQSSTASGDLLGIEVQGNSATIQSSTASGNLRGIYVLGDSAKIQSSTASGNSDFGIEAQGDAASVSGNHADGNGYSGGSDRAGLGINAFDFSTAPVGKNTARGNDDPTECNPTYLC